MSSGDLILTWENQKNLKLKEALKKRQQELECPVIGIESSLNLEKKIPFYSIRDLQDKSIYKGHDEQALKLARQLINFPELSFLNYKSYDLLFIVEFWLANYFGRALQFLADFEEIESQYSSASVWHIISTREESNNWIEKACQELPYIILNDFSEKYNINVRCHKLPIKENGSLASKKSFNLKKELKQNANVRKFYLFFKKLFIKILYKKNDKVLLIDKWKNVSELFEGNNPLVPIRPVLNNRISKNGNYLLKKIKESWLENKSLLIKKLSSNDDFYDLTEATIFMIDCFVNSEAQNLIRWIDSLEDQVQDEKIKLIFLRIDSRDKYRIGALVGNKHKIPAVVLQHGIIGHPHSGYGFCPINVNKYLVFGKYDKQIMKELGENEDKIKEVGNPKLDRTYYLSHEQKHKRVKRSKGSLNILFTTATVRTTVRRTFGNTHLTSEDIYNQFKLLQLALSDLNLLDNLIIKLHPGDNKSEYHISLAHSVFGRECTILKDGDIVQLISESDVLVTLASTTALEAMACGTPVIVIGDDIEKNYYKQMIKEDVVLYAQSSEDLKKKIAFLKDADNWRRQSEKAKKYLKNNYALDGNANERIRNLMVDMASNIQ